MDTLRSEFQEFDTICTDNAFADLTDITKKEFQKVARLAPDNPIFQSSMGGAQASSPAQKKKKGTLDHLHGEKKRPGRPPKDIQKSQV